MISNIDNGYISSDDEYKIILDDGKKYTTKFTKKSIDIRYYKTQPCAFVERKGYPDSFGICSRKSCSYAHSLQELRFASCNFGDGCYRQFDNDRICTFKHPSETIDEYYTRIGKKVPYLPLETEKKEVVTKLADVSPIVKETDFPVLESTDANVIKPNKSNEHIVSSLEDLFKILKNKTKPQNIIVRLE